MFKREILFFYPTYNVVQALCSDSLMHLLVTIELVSNSSEQTGPVLTHLLDQVTFPPHHSLETQVLVLPLLLGEVLTDVTVLVLTVVPLLLLLLLLLPDRDGTGDPGGAAGQAGWRSELILVAQVMSGPLTGGSSVQRVIIVQLVVRRVSLITAVSSRRSGGAAPPQLLGTDHSARYKESLMALSRLEIRL